MQFNVQDRLLLQTMINPDTTGHPATLRVLKDLQNELGFTEEEIKELNFRYEGGKTFWDASNVPLKEISIGPAALDAVFLPLQVMAQAEPPTLKMQFLEIYEKLEKAKDELSTPKLAAV